jgi:Fic family protein
LQKLLDRRVDRLEDQVTQLDPLLPSEQKQGALLEKCHDLIRASERLAGLGQNTGAMQELARLLKAMNSYYSNRIEGEHTRPVEIERALAKRFSPDSEKARLQRLALAHIETEQWLLQTPPDGAEVYSTAALADIHRHLFSQLPAADRFVVMRNDQGEEIERIVAEPGAFRSRQVAVARHLPPSPVALPAMLDRWSSEYRRVRRGEAQVLAVAASHHRLARIHPFLDGNGRTARLHSLAAFRAMGLTTGLWSPLRGLARRATEYAEHLANADMPRMNDLDGRGQRSERMLVAWCDFFLDTCLDQVRFMSAMLNLGEIQDRIAALIAFESRGDVRSPLMSTIPALRLLFNSGSMARGDFVAVCGLSSRAGSDVIQRLLQLGLLVSDSPKGQIRFGVPLAGLRFLFPSLWPEAEADAELARGEATNR